MILEVALLAATAVNTCNWKHPGANPYMGNVPAAVDSYTFMPDATRAKIKARMEKREYDDIVTITRDKIEGKKQYDSVMHGMHSGKGSYCGIVKRTWKPTQVERALTYCEGSFCVIVPTVCRNVSWIRRLDEPAAPPAIVKEEVPPFVPEVTIVPVPPAYDDWVFGATPYAYDFNVPEVFASKGPVGYPYPAPYPVIVPGGLPGYGYTPPPIAAAIPEPSTYLLMFLGIGALTLRLRTRS